jgi:hypothetical protein
MACRYPGFGGLSDAWHADAGDLALAEYRWRLARVRVRVPGPDRLSPGAVGWSCLCRCLPRGRWLCPVVARRLPSAVGHADGVGRRPVERLRAGGDGPADRADADRPGWRRAGGLLAGSRRRVAPRGEAPDRRPAQGGQRVRVGGYPRRRPGLSRARRYPSGRSTCSSGRSGERSRRRSAGSGKPRVATPPGISTGRRRSVWCRGWMSAGCAAPAVRR